MPNKFLLLALILCLFSCSHFHPTRDRGVAAKGKIIKKTKDKTSCFPKKLNKMLLQVSKAFGKPVAILSGYRSPADNKRRGGASGSMHIHCKAADFRVVGANKDKVARYLVRMKGRGGLGLYCKGRYHLDTGKKRHWGGCKSKYISHSNDELTGLFPYAEYDGEIIYDAATLYDGPKEDLKEIDDNSFEFGEEDFYNSLIEI